MLVARSEKPLQELTGKTPSQIIFIAGDLAETKTAKESVTAALKKFGRIDGLILNHGVLEPATRIADSNAEEWKKCFDVNFFSAVTFVYLASPNGDETSTDRLQIQAALPSLRQTNGRVIFTSSGAAVKGYSTWGAYGASKAAVNHLCQTLATEEPKVTSIAVRPGVVDTQMQRDIRDIHSAVMDEKDAAKFRSLQWDGGIIQPEQPGHVIAELVIGAPKDLSGKFLE